MQFVFSAVAVSFLCFVRILVEIFLADDDASSPVRIRRDLDVVLPTAEVCSNTRYLVMAGRDLQLPRLRKASVATQTYSVSSDRLGSEKFPFLAPSRGNPRFHP